MTFGKTLSLLLLTILVSSSFMRISGLEKNAPSAPVESPVPADPWLTSGLQRTAISEQAFRLALRGYDRLLESGAIAPGTRLAIADFSRPSTQERLAIYDVSEQRLLTTSLVAHGRNSGNLMATRFSNIPQSYMSSLGFYLTAETYSGKHGYSLRLDGLEPGFNDKARERAVVIHGADYATRSFVTQHGRLGRSFGCPALPAARSSEIIDEIKDRQVLFIYADDETYLTGSPLLNS